MTALIISSAYLTIQTFFNFLFSFSFCIRSHFCLLCPIGFQFYNHHPNPNLFFLTSPLPVHLSINTSALPANTAASTQSLLHLITAAPSELASPGWRFLDTSFCTLSLSDMCQKAPLQLSIHKHSSQLHYHPVELLPTSCPSSPFLHLSSAPIFPTALPLLSTNSSTLGLPLEADFLWLPVSSASHFK